MVLGKKMWELRQTHKASSFFVVYALTAKRGFVLQRLGELPRSGGGGGEEQETHHFI